MADRPSPLALQIDDLLNGAKVPLLLLGLLLAAGGLYLVGVLGEEGAGAVGVVLVALMAAALMLRGAAVATPAARALAVAAALVTLAAVILPALPTVAPGQPIAEGELGLEGDRMALPAGAHGRLRLLVSGKLREGGEVTVTYAIAGPEPEVAGRVERVYRQVRVGRGGRGRAAADHNADWYDAVIPPGTSDLTLRRITGQLGSRLRVAVFRPVLPEPWPWALAAAGLLLAALAEARLGRKNGVAVPASMGLAFGLLVTHNATPMSAVGQVGGGVILGAIAGSLVGWAAGALMRKLVPPQAAP